MNLRRWLTVGIGVKRWLLLAFLGLLILALGVAHVLRQVTAGAAAPSSLLGQVLDAAHAPGPAVRAPRADRSATLGADAVPRRRLPPRAGAGRPVRAVGPRPADGRGHLPEAVPRPRPAGRGARRRDRPVDAPPRAQGAHLEPHRGRDRRGRRRLVRRAARGARASRPSGDIRNCIVALADAEPLMGRLLQYRFPGCRGGRADGARTSSRRATRRRAPSLSGHAVGNLLLAALVELEDGDFEEAVREMNRVLAVRGRVVPATATPLTPPRPPRRRDRGRRAEPDREDEPRRPRVGRRPTTCGRPTTRCAAIAEAEVIVLGPGSACSPASCPCCSCPGSATRSRRRARSSCSRATSRRSPARPAGSTSPTTSTSLERHGAGRAPGRRPGQQPVQRARRPPGWLGEPVRLRWPPAGANPPRLILDDLVDPANAHHHDPERLATAVMGAWERESRLRRRPAARPCRPDCLRPGGCRAPIATSWRPSGRSSRPSTRPAPATGSPRSRAWGRIPSRARGPSPG